MAIATVKSQSKAAKLFSKKSKAARLFAAKSNYGTGLIQRIALHCNGSLKEPLRKVDYFVEHNSAEELVEIGLLSESAIFLRELDGRDRQLCHLHSHSQAESYPGGKINNVSNLIVLLRETNQMIGARCISRANAEVLDRIIYTGNYLAARVFANQVCS
jgi:hypothetical protein